MEHWTEQDLIDKGYHRAIIDGLETWVRDDVRGDDVDVSRAFATTTETTPQATTSKSEGLKPVGGRKPLERHLEAFVRGAAGVLGWQYYHTWRSIHSPAGFPDDVLVRPPRVIFAELKRDGTHLSANQQDWAGLLRRCPGVEYYEWHNADEDEILRILT